MCGHLSLNVSSSGDKFENTASTINSCWSCDTVQNINILTYWRVVVKGTAWICSVSTFTKLLAVLAKRFLLQRRFLSEGRWLNTAQLLFNTRDRGSAYTSQVLRPVFIYIYTQETVPKLHGKVWHSCGSAAGVSAETSVTIASFSLARKVLSPRWQCRNDVLMTLKWLD